MAVEVSFIADSVLCSVPELPDDTNAPPFFMTTKLMMIIITHDTNAPVTSPPI